MLAPDKPVFVISDLHLGDAGPRDNFALGGRREELDKFLDYVSREGGQLVINGDMFEFWQSSLGRVLVAREALLDTLAQMDTVYVVGNHDADLAALVGTGFMAHPFFGRMSGAFDAQIGGRKFRFMHGHEVDPYNVGDQPSWGRILAIFAGIFEDRNGSPMLANQTTVEEELEVFGTSMLQLWNWLVKYLKSKVASGEAPSPKRELTPAQNPDRLAEHLQQIAEDRKTHGYDVAIVGHTHRPGRAPDGDWYFNSGSWVTRENNYLLIAPDGKVQLFEWRNGQPQRDDRLVSVRQRE